MFKLLLVTTFLIVGTQAAIVKEGECPATSTQRFFSTFLMKGKWFEVKRYPFAPQIGNSCSTWEWTNNGDGSVELRVQGISLLGRNTDQSYTFQTDRSNRAILTYDTGLLGVVEFQVLATDYLKYAVIYWCDEIPLVKATTQRAWILSRSVNGLDSLSARKVNQVIEQNGLDADLFNEVSQDCS